MLVHTKMHRTNTHAEILVTVPLDEGNNVNSAIESLLRLGGHTIRRCNDEGEDTLSMAEVFPEATPGMILQGFRGRDELTQGELAKLLKTTQNMVSDMENNKRPISVKMAKALGEVFEVSYKAFL